MAWQISSVAELRSRVDGQPIVKAAHPASSSACPVCHLHVTPRRLPHLAAPIEIGPDDPPHREFTMKTLLAASGTTLALLAAPSWAMPGSIAQLDWSSLAVTAPSGLSWDAPQTWVRGFVDPDGGTDAVADWSSTLSHQALGGGVTATGSANATSLTAEITGAWSGGSLASVYAAQGNTWRTANFSLAPGQSLQVSVAYHLSEDTTGLPTSQQYATTA
jgi:hypothetical protein